MWAARSLYFLDGNMSSLTQSGTNIICLGLGLARWFAQPNQLNKRVWLQVLWGRRKHKYFLTEATMATENHQNAVSTNENMFLFYFQTDTRCCKVSTQWRWKNGGSKKRQDQISACDQMHAFSLHLVASNVFLSFLAVRYLPLAAFNCLHLHPFMCCLVLPPTACYCSAPTKAKEGIWHLDFVDIIGLRGMAMVFYKLML